MSHVLCYNRETTEIIQVEPHFSGGRLKNLRVAGVSPATTQMSANKSHSYEGGGHQHLMWFYLLFILGATLAVKRLF